MTEVKSAYLGEAMLVRWGETGKGRTVTLQLDEHVGVTHPFKGLKAGENGQRMKLVAVLIDDQEQPQDPDQARRSVPPKKAQTSNGESEVTQKVTSFESAEKEREPRVTDKPKVAFKELPRSQQAALKLRDEEFQEWLDGYSEDFCIGNGLLTRPTSPDGRLKLVLGLASKTELDTNPDAAEEFDKLLASYDYRNQVRA